MAGPSRTSRSRDEQQQTGIYGIFPADIEVTAEQRGVGDPPGTLRVIRSASEEAVARELLEEHREEFAQGLSELEGRGEFVVKGRYVEQAILGEVLSGSRQAARLREEIRGKDADATRDARIQLGEIINDAINAKRQEDTRVLGDRMADHCVASLVRDPTHERDAVHVAFLLDTSQENARERVIEDLAKAWAGRVEFRLLGPMAAYDFVTTTEPGG